MKMKLIAVVVIFSLYLETNGSLARLYSSPRLLRSQTAGTSPDISYETKYFEVPVDHFGFANKDTFKLRYLVADKYWNTNGGPIFFYTGNEGDITWFCNNTGFMWDIAPEFKALLVFAEHRYYGTSLPYGQDSYKDLAHLGYLSSEQALADFADLITHIRADIPGAQESAIIAFGGSYGGMLASWFRMKYPHAVNGAIAASAPILWFGDLTPCNAYYKVTTQDFARENANCPKNIKRSWGVMTEAGSTATGRDSLTKVMRLCDPLKTVDDVTTFKEWLQEMWGSLAMMDYPYPTDFMETLPGWPIKAVCNYLSDSSVSDLQLLENIAQGINVYFNYTGNVKCFNTSQAGAASLGDTGWNFQACTEMVMPLCTDGVSDMFEPSPWNLTTFTEGCQKQWGVTPRPDWVITQYGGRNISAASNIVFSNGKLDPWSGGGVLESVSESVVAVIIDLGAHHLDLRSANPKDPASVIAARQAEKAHLQKWINEAKIKKTDRSLPPSPVNPKDNNLKSTQTGTYVIIAVLGTIAGLIVVLGIAIMLRNQKWHQDVKIHSQRKFGMDSPAPILQDTDAEGSLFSSPLVTSTPNYSDIPRGNRAAINSDGESESSPLLNAKA